MCKSRLVKIYRKYQKFLYNITKHPFYVQKNVQIMYEAFTIF